MSVRRSSDPGAAQTAFIDGIADIAGRYDGFLIDQWGVLHDGGAPYPGALDCLSRLKTAGKRVVILSNSGRSAEDNADVMARIGFPRDLYERIASAGDDAREALAAREPPYDGYGRRCLALTRDGEHFLADCAGLRIVESVEDADFLFAISMDPDRQSVSGWTPLLERAAARGLPLVCANPDIHRVHPDGRLREAPGKVARCYEAMGGRVTWHGKPHARIYSSSLARLGLPKDRVLAIGDSLEHDVRGAFDAGIDVAFIAHGVHRDALDWTAPDRFDPASAGRLFDQWAAAPRYGLARFAWGAD